MSTAGIYPVLAAASIGLNLPEGVTKSASNEFGDAFIQALAGGKEKLQLTDLRDFLPPSRQRVVERLEELEKGEARNSSDAAVILEKTLLFHQLHEGPESLAITNLPPGYVRVPTSNNSLGDGVALTSKDNGDTLILTSVFPVPVSLPPRDSLPAGFSVKLRNTHGTLRVPKSPSVSVARGVLGPDLKDLPEVGSYELTADHEFTLTLSGLGWTITLSEVDVVVTDSQDGLMLERDDIQGIRVLLPDLVEERAGFAFLACNRRGRMTVVSASPSQPVLRIPDDLGSAIGAQNQVFEHNEAVRVRWDGFVWSAVSETTDEEFHRNIAGLDSHPTLARAVGLTWDVEIALTDAEVQSISSSGFVSLIVDDPGRGLVFAPYSVAYEKTSLVPGELIAFSARSAEDSRTRSVRPFSNAFGFLDLSTCVANQVEVDVPVIALFNQFRGLLSERALDAIRAESSKDVYVNAARRVEMTRKSYRPEDTRDVLPALTEAGIELSNPLWSKAHQEAGARAKTLEVNFLSAYEARYLSRGQKSITPDPSHILYLEDLLRGFRFDVLDLAIGRWKSLCQQKVTIRKKNSTTAEKLVCGDEGAVTHGITSDSTIVKQDGSVKPVSRGSEVFFRWVGHGVTRPRPIPGVPQPRDESAALGLGLVAEHTRRVGTEKKMRVGRRYQFRARLVDIAGNSWSSEDADKLPKTFTDDMLSPAVGTMRFQPAKVPKLAIRTTQGSVETRSLVIHSYDGRTATSAHYEAYCPRIGFELLQLLGMTDGVPPNEAVEILRDAQLRSIGQQLGTAHDPRPPKGLINTRHLGIEDPDVHGVSWWFLPGNERPAQSKVPDLKTGENTFEGATPKITSFSSRTHPNGLRYAVTPVRIELSSSGRRASEGSDSQLRLELPPGESQQIILSSSLRDATHFGLFHAVADITPPTDHGRMAQRAREGAMPILTPFVVVQVVHASQRPITAPMLASPYQATGGQIVQRGNTLGVPQLSVSYGQLEVEINIDYRAHFPSTGRIDIEANWTEPDDVPLRREWLSLNKHESITHWALDSSDLTFALDTRAGETRRIKHKFPDTRRHTVKYTAVATSRYAEFFNHYVKNSAGEEEPVPGMQVPASDPYLREADFQRRSAALEVVIPNRAEPPSFQIEYVIPKSMIQETYSSKGDVVSNEETRELRVYVRRPAWASGEGEMLGVLVAPFSPGAGVNPNDPGFADELGGDAVSELAEDPLNLSEPIVDANLTKLTVSFFPEPDEPARTVVRQALVAGLRLADSQSRTATVLGYRLQEIKGEDLLYADVRIAATDRAAPFLRLALVRYQPVSCTGAHVSNRAVMAYVRPSTDRSITVRFEKVDSGFFLAKRKLNIKVVGPAATDDSGNISSLMSLTLTRGRSTTAAASKSVPLSSRWLSHADFLAEWSVELMVKDSGPFDDIFHGHCLGHIVETVKLFSGNETKWFSDFKLGSIEW
jgi:hypothetical protein